MKCRLFLSVVLLTALSPLAAQEFTTARSKSEFVISTDQWGFLWFDASDFDEVKPIAAPPISGSNHRKSPGFRGRNSFYAGGFHGIHHWSLAGSEWQFTSSREHSSIATPLGTARGPDNRLYMADQNGSQIIALGNDELFHQADGTVENRGPLMEPFLTSVSFPQDIAFCPLTRQMAVALWNGDIDVYSGKTLRQDVPTLLTGLGSGGVRGIAYDPNGYVLTDQNGEIVRDESGKPVIRSLLYVSSLNGNLILRFDAITGAPYGSDPDNRENGIFVPSGSGGLTSPRGLAFSPDDGYLYVVGYGAVYRFQPDTGAPAGDDPENPASALLRATANNMAPNHHIAFRMPEKLYDFHKGGVVLLDNGWLEVGSETWFKAAMDQQLQLFLTSVEHAGDLRIGANVKATVPHGVDFAVGSFFLNGGSLIGQAGGNVIAAGGNNVIVPGGGNVIAAGGNNVIAAGGGNVIAAGGNNVIAAGGNNVIAAGGNNFMGSTMAFPTSASATSFSRAANALPLETPVTGTFTIQGNYMQGEGTDLFLTIGGATFEEEGLQQYDRLAVGATARLSGRIIISLLDLEHPGNWQTRFWLPSPGDTFDVIVAGQIIPDGFTAISLVQGLDWTYEIVTYPDNRHALRLTLQAVHPPQTAYQQWAQNVYGFHGAPAAAPHYDASGDGITSLLAYALNLDPTRSSVKDLPRPQRKEIDGMDCLVFEYERHTGKNDLLYTIQVSENLQNDWASVTDDQVLSITHGIELRQARVPATASRKFLRLKVTAKE